ncbi:MAG: ABC transporter ATP-binding protein [Planctomycetes bacterium]|nr:ABC transporter ATP-binding protein [Planctomycetota bacterium]
MTAADEPIIQMKGVTFSYNGQPVLEDVNLAITPRDFVTVLGPNGGGKTTLLRLMLGLLRPSRGTVRIFGQDPEAARARIGYMPQHAYVDPRFPVRVLDVVLMGRLRKGRRWGPFGRNDKHAAAKALGEVELGNMARRPFAELSGGQRQRVLIARALVGDPELLLFDEPMANLDVVIEGEIHHLLCRLNRHVAVVTVSHDVGFVTHCVKTVVCVNRRVWVHPTQELTGDLIAEVYGGNLRMVRHGNHDGMDGGAACPNS